MTLKMSYQTEKEGGYYEKKRKNTHIFIPKKEKGKFTMGKDKVQLRGK